MKGKSKAGTPREYIEGLREPRRGEIQQLHRLITKTAPKLKPKMWSGMIGYGSYHYRYATGREGDWFVVGLMSRKDGISFYSCLSDGKKYIAEKHKKDLLKADIGRSCIRFKRLADVDLRILAGIVKENEAAAKKMKG
ncbi:MAG: DUF1801 domain-containing protein [Candidatus Acidiferrales bacterium]